MSGARAPGARLARPVPRALVRLALPVLASQALRLAYQWVDALWVRGLGVNATAAVTTSVFVLWAMYSLHDVFGVGLAAYVSQLLGAGDRERAGIAVRKGLLAALATGLAGTLLGLFAARPLYALMDPGGTAVADGAAYLRVALTGIPFVMLALTCEVTMRAAGDTRTPLLVDVAAVLLNVALAPVLIYGLGPAPRLGVAGAALATVTAQALMLGCYLVLAARGHPALPLTLGRPAPGRDLPPVRIAGLARVGLPAALIGLLFSVVYVAFTRAASPWGAAAVAVVGLANRLEAVQFIVSLALGLAGASLLGQALGAGRPERAAEVLRTGQRWIVLVSLALTATYLAAPRALLSLFSRDPQLLALGTPYLRVLALALPATGIEIVTAETVLGSGHTQVMSRIFTAFSLLRIPLAFVVPRWGGLGVTGIAWLIAVTCVLRCACIVGWAARGTWKRGLTRELHGAAPAAGAPPAAGAGPGAAGPAAC